MEFLENKTPHVDYYVELSVGTHSEVPMSPLPDPTAMPHAAVEITSRAHGSAQTLFAPSAEPTAGPLSQAAEHIAVKPVFNTSTTQCEHRHASIVQRLLTRSGSSPLPAKLLPKLLLGLQIDTERYAREFYQGRQNLQLGDQYCGNFRPHERRHPHLVDR